MDQYYYDCPIEAAYMTINFGFKFVSSKGCEARSRNGYWKERPYKTLSNHWIKCDKQMGYVDINCYSILFPQKDDLVDLQRFGFGFVTEVDGNNINVGIYSPDTGVFKNGYWFRRWHPIIARKGKPFIMPNIELENDING